MIEYIDWGLIPYSQAYEKQKELFNSAITLKTANKEVHNKMIYCEHPHVITVGKNGLFANLLFPEKVLKEKGVELFHVNRGGDITYHGPGQIVGYPIFDLESFNIGLKEYIHKMEEVIIKTIGEYGLKGEHLQGATGVWLDINSPDKARKIAAIGVKSSRYVTMHGFALNINTQLDYFNLINPCGFVDKGVTSLEREISEKISIKQIKPIITKYFDLLF